METFDEIMRRSLARAPDDIDKREGSILYDALAPMAMELVNLYAQLQYVEDQAFPDTADRENLIRKCAERGITPYPATHALLAGQFEPSVPIGARFNLDDLNFVVVAHITGTAYQVECETLGEAGGRRLGTLLPIDHIDGLRTARLTSVLIPGEDEEGTEALRKRFLAGFDSQAFGGNIADYQEKIGALAGVGGVKVYPVRDGGGTVAIVITASDNTAPTAELCAAVQEAVDPEPSGSGRGLAPIDHKVSIEGARAVPVDIAAALTYQQGYAWESVQEAVNTAVEGYLAELRAAWEETDKLIVRISQIETRILDVPGVLDIGRTTLCGQAENLVLGEDEVPVKGELHAASD